MKTLRFNCILSALTLCLALSTTTAIAADATAPVRVEETAESFTADNGLVSLTLDRKTGQVDMIRLRRASGELVELSKPGEGLYWDANVDLLEVSPEMAPKQPRAGYSKLGRMLKEAKLVRQDADAVEFVASAGPTYWFPFEVDNHIVLRRNDPGFYAYSVIRHGPGMAGAKLVQTRLVLRGVPGTKLFTHFVVDDARKAHRPTSPVVETIQDATSRLADGTAFTKYNLAAFTHDYLAHGLVGNGVGLWVCYPSTESFNGGPVRQDLTVHDDSVLLAMWQSQHYGAGPAVIEDDEAWSHLYGPVFVYVNSGDSVDAMHADAQLRAQAEQKQWPYAWLKHPEYPLTRSTVTGRVQKATGETVAGAWAILCRPEAIDWAESAKGYMFWTRVADDGTFAIRNVRPGDYRLVVSGGDEPTDFQVNDVSVGNQGTVDLGTLHWSPERNGQRLWQIGTFDRSTREYLFGQEKYYRDYDAFLRYFERFPEDVAFVVGKSDEAKDWHYSHWAWFNKRPTWDVKFDLDQPLTGTATLTLGLAAVRPAGALEVKVNGSEVARFEMPKSGAAGYRSGGQDSRYTFKRIEFDASLLRAGANEVTFGHSNATKVPTTQELAEVKVAPGGELGKGKRPPGEVMYDAIRLEVR